ncbi:MAG: iron-sulfur cluster repair di-iron protein [Cyclobacteriaceae bacterium]
MKVFDQTISDIVDENYVYARALSHLGIAFYECPNSKLGDICAKRGLVKDQVMRSFYLFDRNHRLSLSELEKYPIEIIIQYLKHTHSIFVRDKLPYIAKLIHFAHGNEDMKLIFPEFVNEFIRHIHEEEDGVFCYIQQLVNVDSGKISNPATLFARYKKYSLKEIHEEHLEEDEMAGIRTLLNGMENLDLHWRVVSKEIKAFDREMMYHAEIENEIMFPKAISLEASVRERMHQLSKLN